MKWIKNRPLSPFYIKSLHVLHHECGHAGWEWDRIGHVMGEAEMLRLLTDIATSLLFRVYATRFM